jgi:transcriptional regulator with GAF, ATPase, and Fis domain
MDFDFPATDALPATPRFVPHPDNAEPQILTESEMKQRDQENHLAALQKANWKIKGAHGAAELLGLIMKPTTLLTRMKRMRLRRPASVEAQKY